MIIIGLAGKARVGKDTAATYLSKQYRLMPIAFAQPIKDALTALGFRQETYDTDEQKNKVISWLGVSYRKLAQTLGTEWGRFNVHPELWLLLARNKVEAHKALGGTGVVISDVRFDNEADWIRAQGGLIIHMEGPARSGMAVDGEGHASERGIRRELNDVVVSNNGSLDFLYRQLDTVMETLEQDRRFLEHDE